MSLHKLDKKRYSDDAMSRALIDVNSKTLSLRAAAKKYGVPKSSLSDRYTGKVQEGSKWGRKTIFTYQEERNLIEHAMKRADLGIGFTKSNFLRFVGNYAKETKVPFNTADASEKWWRGFKSRHADFSLRAPEATSSGRHAAMTRERICKYFAALKGVLEENKFEKYPERIWNMDETGLSLSHKPAKVIAKKGARAVQSKVSLNRELVTIIACGNAKGQCIPPHVILPGKSERVMKGYDIDFAPLGTNLSVSETGWTKEGIGRLWFQSTFLEHIGNERPQLLIFDGHASHNHMEFIEIARKENIVLVELPSKTSHWTQPFDRTVFKSLKTKWNTNIQTFMSDTGVSVGHAQFFRMFTKSWNESMNADNISSGFVSTGICPYNPGAIPNIAYTPSDLYVDENKLTTPSTTRNPCSSACNSNHTTPSQDDSQAVGPQVPHPNVSQPSLPSSPHSNVVVEASCEVPVPLPLPDHVSSDTQQLESTVFSFDVISSGAQVIDLPAKIDSSGNLTMVTEHEAIESVSSNESSVSECPTDMALRVIESALTDDMKKKYREAFQQGLF
ncbi:uncharacterized protein LOC132716309 [Ruditapes philippinarum]|uniref:uncharacterized protein LOC132716309 n=1 Tax=Ruditapes philippinarum TaxID=129788 RepID=UPI00295BACB8|nr:uncharacterized protein LOC132716309 [Ruditapes philippinarum]